MKGSDYSCRGSFDIPRPRGVNQSAGDTNIDTDYAYRAENIRTERGLLASAYGTSVAFACPEPGVQIETFTRFYRRNRRNENGDLEDDAANVFVACGGGSIYTITRAGGWIRCVPYDAEGNEMTTPFLCDRWSTVTYEEEADGETVDILILSNAKDGMYVIRGTEGGLSRVERKKLTIGSEFAEVRFGVLGRYGERIWGTGDTKNPDKLFYSRPYSPFNWTQADNEEAKMGGGTISIPTWDGDSFIALSTFGGYLLAIKRNSVFEIRGTDPSTFSLHEAYGTDGPVQGETVCVDRMGMYYLSREGLGMYDGAAIQRLGRDVLHEIMSARMEDRQDAATACICNHVYYLALAVKEGDFPVVENNMVVEYDTERGTFMIRTGIRVKDFYALDGQVYFTDAESPNQIMRYSDPQARGYDGLEMQCMWETPWMDLGKGLIKRDFVLRFTAEADEAGLPLEISLATERREKTRQVLLSDRRRDYRVKIQSAGKRVRLRIRTAGRAAGWRIYGGVQVEYTCDEE